MATIEKRSNQDGTVTYRVKIDAPDTPHAPQLFIAMLMRVPGTADGSYRPGAAVFS